jgi:hypothetical protein
VQCDAIHLNFLRQGMNLILLTGFPGNQECIYRRWLFWNWGHSYYGKWLYQDSWTYVAWLTCFWKSAFVVNQLKLDSCWVLVSFLCPWIYGEYRDKCRHSEVWRLQNLHTGNWSCFASGTQKGNC